VGVAVGALAVELAVQFKGTGVITAEDFRPAFFLIGAISASSALTVLDGLARMPAPRWRTARRSPRPMRRINASAENGQISLRASVNSGRSDQEIGRITPTDDTDYGKR